MIQADTALYHAKQSGRGRYSYFTGQMSEKADQRMRMEHDLRLALFRDAQHDSPHALAINRVAVVGLGLLGLLMMMYAPPFMLSWLGILGSGTLLAAMIGPVFISTFWQGNVAGALVAMLVGFATSAGLLTLTDLGWVEGPLIGCAASSLCYFAVSLLTGRAASVRTRQA